ncbi:hypothetical protein CCY99_02515 [Helicobacter sp. 16-1353]|uniref:shikimate kinase n=1 Tax=Helicobacter sp. 16-1353 TaxID=2004996 RepID=UPI000DCF0E5C|nr:shikimate kinase [Helicobacter sp. 16-1353]RAX54656.1 hypothetical protein CCY99_02515 [Helicobacter sp. 16-1353]
MLNNIVLIGFMGSGKTTIGRELARLFENVLLDTDSIIETNYNMQVNDIFTNFGEERFREIEISLCDWIKNNVNNAIISTGGGMPMRYDIRDIGNVFYLEAPLDELSKRIIKDGIQKRPMFEQFSAIDDLYQSRVKIYKNMADYTLNALDSANEIAEKIYNYVKGY